MDRARRELDRNSSAEIFPLALPGSAFTNSLMKKVNVKDKYL